jgi:hypothetical protein
MTLLRQIQDELASADVDVVAVLRKCKILARRLHSDDFAKWVDCELNGYPDEAEVPAYRTVHPVHFASFSNGYWSAQQQPISTLVIDKKWRHIFEPFSYRAGIAAVQALAATNGGGMLDRNELRFLLKGKVFDLPCHQFWSQVSELELKQIVSAVVNRLLDFVMDVEAENPNAGEAPPSEMPVAPERVQQLVENHFHGPVGNIAQNSSGFSQTATLNFDQVRDLVATIRSQLAMVALEPATRASAQDQLDTIDAELVAPTPHEGIVREAGRSLRNILEGVVAGAIAQPQTWHAILGTMKSVFGP